MSLISTNPANQEKLAEFNLHTAQEVQAKIQIASDTYHKKWKYSSFEKRKKLMLNLALVLRNKRVDFSQIIAQEMGMPITQANAEIEKSSQLAEYYAEKAQNFLADEYLEAGFKQSYVSYEPLGTLLHIAPWNFPFYLALRPVLPAIMAGNTVILKHASNVPTCSQTLEGIFLEAGFEVGVFQSLLISSKEVGPIIKDDRISMVSLIGSEFAGSKVAQTAGSQVKKSLMELGGSDPFIVLKDADLDKVFPSASSSRLRNCGQSCNAAKRFIVAEEVAEQFLERLKYEFENQIIGDPLDNHTTLGPLATQNSLLETRKQVEKSLQMGAKILTGGHGGFLVAPKKYQDFDKTNRKGYYYLPTILVDTTSQMPIRKEEVFAPVAPVVVVQSLEEAISVANETRYGLGASIWSQDLDLAKQIIPQLEAGIVAVNSMVRSSIKMPYGGVKKTGYGREMGPHGIKEFVNVKSVVIT